MLTLGPRPLPLLNINLNGDEEWPMRLRPAHNLTCSGTTTSVTNTSLPPHTVRVVRGTCQSGSVTPLVSSIRARSAITYHLKTGMDPQRQDGASVKTRMKQQLHIPMVEAQWRRCRSSATTMAGCRKEMGSSKRVLKPFPHDWTTA